MKKKGQKNGICNRSACMSSVLEEVIFYNKGTRKYYCGNCALLINNANKNHPDTFRIIKDKYLCRTDDGLLPQEYWRKQIQEEK